jgi:ATP-binding cassette subfamily B protein
MRGRGKFLTEDEKATRPEITKELLKRIFSYLSPYKGQMALVVVLIILSSALSLFPSLLTGRIIDDGFIGGDFDLLIRLVGLSFAVLIASNLIDVLNSYLNTWIAQHITFDMKTALYGHLQHMSQRFFATSRQGEIITRMTSDIEGVQQVIAGTLVSLIRNVALVALALAAMFNKNWILALIGSVMVPFFAIPTKMVGKRRWKMTGIVQGKKDEVNQILNETLSVSGQQLVKIFTNEPKEYENYRQANKDLTELNIRESLAGRWFRMGMSIFTNIGPMLIYLAAGYLMLKRGDSGLTVGDVTVIVTLLGRLYRPVNSLLDIQVDVIKSMALFTRIFDYFDMPVEIKNAEHAIVPERVTGNLRFDRVRFYYDEQKEVLRDVSFQVPAGRTVAIVGPSGSGKSTIANLVMRLYDVIDGSITIDGLDVRDLDLAFLRSSIGMVTQETYLFNGTIRENLLYANAESTEADLIAACRDANIHDFIATLPDGYDTEIGNRGVKLSGGEKQRLSIARAILKNPHIMILDEATSSLDSISENLIQEAIEPLLAGRTSIVIAHRLSTVLFADEILVLKDGTIVERGSHRELLTEGGVYAELYETQFKKALEEHREMEREAGRQPAG